MPAVASKKSVKKPKPKGGKSRSDMIRFFLNKKIDMPSSEVAEKVQSKFGEVVTSNLINGVRRQLKIASE